MSTETMMALARRVAEARRTAAGYDETVRAARAEFEAANAELLAQAKAAKAAVEAAEGELRALALAAYKTTRDKAPAPGVLVKVGQSLVYDDNAALAWAHETGLALVPESVDRKALERIAKATPLPFGSYEERPVVTLASDMDAALAVVEPAPAPEAAAEPMPF